MAKVHGLIIELSTKNWMPSFVVGCVLKLPVEVLASSVIKLLALLIGFRAKVLKLLLP
jgi:hypothetical protein